MQIFTLKIDNWIVIMTIFFMLNSCSTYNFSEVSYETIQNLSFENYYFPPAIIKKNKVKSCAVYHGVNKEGKPFLERQYEFNQLGLISKIIKNDPQTQQILSTSAISYTAKGEKISELDIKGSKKYELNYYYDNQNKLTHTTYLNQSNFEGNTSKYKYEKDKLDKIQYFDNKFNYYKSKEFKYDVEGKITQILEFYPHSEEENKAHTFVYDDAGRVKEYIYIYLNEGRAIGNFYAYNKKGLIDYILTAEMNDMAKPNDLKILNKMVIEYNSKDLPTTFLYYLKFNENKKSVGSPMALTFVYN